MADDIDDLLDEVESKFVKRKTGEKISSKEKPARKKPDDEMDDLLNDICGDSDVLDKYNVRQSVPNRSTQPRPVASKCFPVCIGGASITKGIGNSVNKRSCDTLRCTSCDFKVASFDDFDWESSTDYLFLRNNAPDFDRLKSKLTRKKGYRSFCCQCCHIAVNKLTDVKDLQMKWVCGQHS